MASGSGKSEPPFDGIALSNRINQKLRGAVLRPISNRSIFKVPNQLRQINENAYEPEVISIGPYHRGKEHLKAMEEQKMNSLKLFLEGTVESSVEKYVMVLADREEEARNFYSEPLDHIGSEEFVEMMLLDGCFIIELIWQGGGSYGNDFLTLFTFRKVMRDLLLLENQLPLFVLLMLCDLSGHPFTHDVVINIFPRMMARLLIKDRAESVRRTEFNDYETCQHLLDLLRHHLCLSRQRQGTLPTRKWQFIRSATELKEAGIKIKKNSGELFDIKFQNGVISIPALTIDAHTESILRNFVAYEQCYSENLSSKFFTDYITFMDCLINTGKDVELLCGVGVLENWLGDHEVVATMFNRLRDSVLISEANFLSDIFARVNKHCNRECNKRMAILWHNYYNHPGAFISTQNAIVLFLCTLLQTLFSILSYHHQVR